VSDKYFDFYFYCDFIRVFKKSSIRAVAFDDLFCLACKTEE